MLGLKNWLKKKSKKKPEKTYIRAITGKVEVTRREFLMEQLEERIVLHSPGAGDEPLEFYGEEWYEVDLEAYWLEQGLPEEPGREYKPCGNHNEIIYGSEFNDVIDCSGSTKRYIIVGRGGADTITGGDGDDYIYGWNEESSLIHGELDDSDSLGGGKKQVLIGNGGCDWIWGGPFDDIIVGDSLDGGSSYRDRLYANAGDDIVYGDCVSGTGSGADRIAGGPGDDILFGDTADGEGFGPDYIYGGDGHDVIYGDTANGIGHGVDELWGGEGDDTIYGDSVSGEGNANDRITGGPGADELYGDSMNGPGSGNDDIHGGEGADHIYGDSFSAIGSGSDTIYGEGENDVIYGDSVMGLGTGNDTISGGDGDDIVIGDSEDGDGSGNDIVRGGLGADTIYGDSVHGNGSGSDLLDGEQGSDTLIGDDLAGDSAGQDSLYVQTGDTVSGGAQPGDVLVQATEGPDGVSYEITSDDGADYRIDEETGELMVFNYVFARWDPLSERYWDEQQRAWVQTSGLFVDVEYATKHLRYENGGTQIWIQRNGTWEEYDPDTEYIVDMQEDWETGALLVYNNDFGRYEPYGEPFQPTGASYTVINEFDMVYLNYDDGTTICLENFGDGAMLSTEATGYTWIETRGDMYYDSSNGFWWSKLNDTWSFSIDSGSTWKEAPSLEIRVVEDPGAVEFVGVFSDFEWATVDGRLEFLDENYAPTGWHGMNQFYYDLHDGKGYDGEPLTMALSWVGSEENLASNMGPSVPPSLNELDGAWPESGDKVYMWRIYITGDWTTEVKAEFTMYHPEEDYQWRPWNDMELNVTFQANDTEGAFDPLFIRSSSGIESVHTAEGEWIKRPAAIGEHGLYSVFLRYGYAIEDMVEDLQMLQYCFASEANKQLDEIQVQNLVILNHGSPSHPSFRVGTSVIDQYNLCFEYGEAMEDLNSLMKDGGQIQHYGCYTAGPNPGKDYVPPLVAMDGDWRYRSYVSRCILAGIAHLTDTTVFASSDYQWVTLRYAVPFDSPDYILPTMNHLKIYLLNVSTVQSEMCLEFGVNSDGVQVDWEELDESVWADYAWWHGETNFDSHVQTVDYGENLPLDDIAPPPISTKRWDEWESYGKQYDFHRIVLGC